MVHLRVITNAICISQRGVGVGGGREYLNAIIFHTQKKTAGQLRLAGPCIEEGGRGVHKPPLRHQVVGLEGSVCVGGSKG